MLPNRTGCGERKTIPITFGALCWNRFLNVLDASSACIKRKWGPNPYLQVWMVATDQQHILERRWRISRFVVLEGCLEHGFAYSLAGRFVNRFISQCCKRKTELLVALDHPTIRRTNHLSNHNLVLSFSTACLFSYLARLCCRTEPKHPHTGLFVYIRCAQIDSWPGHSAFQKYVLARCALMFSLASLYYFQ